MIFRWEEWEENNNITRKASRSDLLTLLTLLSADAKSAVVLRVPSLTKAKYAISRCYTFPDGSVWFMDNLLCLCDVLKRRSYVNVNVSVSSIFIFEFYIKYHFPCQRNSLLNKIYLSTNCYVSILNFH